VKSFVPILLTCDIHTHVQEVEEVREDLISTRAVFSQYKWPCTFLFPSKSAESLCDQVGLLRDEGHEIGCHGLTHEPSENLALLPLEEQQAILSQATQRLGEILGERPQTFRAPVFKVSGHTVQVLDTLGYQADLSVVAGRLGIFGSEIYNLRPLLGTRTPYHPSIANPYRKGPANLWEIPVSALVLPFLSNTERLLGLSFMKHLFRVLYLEAKITGKPIVFVLHAEDLNPDRGVQQFSSRLSWRHFVPTHRDGFQFRFYLFERNWKYVHRDIVALLRYMQSFPGIHFMRVKDYVQVLNQSHAPA